MERFTESAIRLAEFSHGGSSHMLHQEKKDPRCNDGRNLGKENNRNKKGGHHNSTHTHKK